MTITRISVAEWNRQGKANAVAVKGDICYLIGNLFCLCQTKRQINNIVVFAKEKDVANITATMIFARVLWKSHGIRYVTVESDSDKWKLMRDMFSGLCREKITAFDLKKADRKLKEKIGGKV